MEYFQETLSHPEIDGDQSSPKKWETVSAIATAANTSNGCFECNICLDHARDPVVTLCGHLYCWPCIYKWLDFNNNTFPSDNLPQQPRCPVCKADVSSSTLVPLYGRGRSSPKTDSDGKASSGIEIPNRPPAYGVHAMISNQLQSQFESDQHQQHDQPNYNTHAATATAASPLRFNLGGTMAHPMVFMLCEMVPARMFGNSTTEYRNSYHRIRSTPRMRRQEMKDEKSLHRISIFIFCCVVLFFLLC